MNRRAFIASLVGLVAVRPRLDSVTTYPPMEDMSPVFFTGGQVVSRVVFPEPIIAKTGETIETVMTWTAR